MRFALNSLAVVAPDWLLSEVDAQWVERYGHRIEENRLPKSEGERLALAQQIGEDGRKLLTAIFDSLSPAWLREIPAIEVLRRIWVQNYFVEDEYLRWREAENLPPATLFINSPYDPEAHRGKKRTTDVGLAIKSISPKPANRPYLTSSRTLLPPRLPRPTRR